MKAISYFAIIIISLWSGLHLSAQELNAKEHVELGEELLEKGAYLEAADHFKTAWEEKKKKEEWIYSAAQAYNKAMAYDQAAAAYENLLGEKKYPQAKLELARALKQKGDYTRANKLYLEYLYDYDEDDKSAVEQQVQSEIRGCELGMQLLKAGNTSGLQLKALSDAVNSPGNETNPVPFDQTVLYYNSDITGQSKFYRTERKDGTWIKGIVPPLLPEMNDLSVSNGAFSPDFKRFYFNKCDQQGNGLVGDKNCELYYIVREQDSWSKPIRMKDYINVSGTSNSHPYVVFLDQKEIIYFSSDRSGGHGGKDLWYIVRDLSSDISEYTFPTNLGKNINSPGDEIAPFYAPREGNLYFSSDGRVSLGGFDVFRSKGSEAFWENAENIGLPFNSGAEDFQYRTNSNGSIGYIVSNRKAQGSNNTTDFNIFVFENSRVVKDVVLTGKVMDEDQQSTIANVELELLKKVEGKFELAEKQVSEDGSYRFVLDPSMDYKLTAKKPGYVPMEMVLKSSSISKSVAMEQNMILFTGVASSDRAPANEQAVQQRSSGNPSSSVTKVQTARPTSTTNQPTARRTTSDQPARRAEPAHTSGQDVIPVDNKTVIINKRNTTTVTNNTAQPSSGQVRGRIVDAEPVDAKHARIRTQGNAGQVNYPQRTDAVQSSAIRSMGSGGLSGVYYKVQICSLGDFDPNNSAFDGVRYLGNLDTEFLPSKGMTRVLLGSFSSRSEAAEASSKAKKAGFPGAFLVQYKDGQRLNR